MTKPELQGYLLEAASRNKLLIPKHDPANLGNPWSSYRTVLTPHMAANFGGVIFSGAFDAMEYENSAYPQSPYIAVTPTLPEFSVTASGVQPLAVNPDLPKDRLVFYSGQNQGWHCCGENSAQIQAKVAAGTLLLKGPVV